MTLEFVGGAYNRASGTRNAFGALSDDLVREGHPPMVSISGDREPEEQLRIWHERMTLTPGSRKVYGTAWWQGKKWYRIHPNAVGVPETSNHEKRRSNDLAWPYNSNTAAHRRAKVLAKKHNITCEGENFSEKWHWTFWGALGTIDAAPASTTSRPIDLEEGFLMALSDTQQQQIYDALIKGGYAGYGTPDAIINILRGEIAPAIASIAAGGILFPGQPYLLADAIVNTIRADGGGKVTIDEAEVAAKLAPALAPLIAANLGTLTDETINDLVERLLGEQSKRLAS